MNTLNKKAIGLRIKTIRKQNGLTMKEFGKLIGDAAQSLVTRWENGTSIPNNERIKKIAEIGNVSVSYLLYGKTTFDDLSDEDKARILAEQIESLSSREKGGIEDLLYFLNNPSKSKSYRHTIFLLSTTLRYSHINEKKPDEDPVLIRMMENIVNILNDCAVSGEETSNYTKEEIRNTLIERLDYILDNSKNEIE